MHLKNTSWSVISGILILKMCTCAIVHSQSFMPRCPSCDNVTKKANCYFILAVFWLTGCLQCMPRSFHLAGRKSVRWCTAGAGQRALLRRQHRSGLPAASWRLLAGVCIHHRSKSIQSCTRVSTGKTTSLALTLTACSAPSKEDDGDERLPLNVYQMLLKVDLLSIPSNFILLFSD